MAHGVYSRDTGVDWHDAAQRRFDCGRAAWPDIALEFAEFEQYFRRHAEGGSLPPDAHASDMYLACACSRAVAPALRALDRMLEEDVARAVASIDSSPAFVEETLQQVRERLLISKSSGPSKIADYAGRASLKTWLCTVGVRSAISARRRRDARHHRSAPSEDVRLANNAPELDYLRRSYKETFENAVRSSILLLPSKQRLLLRLNVVDGMSVDRLAPMYRVSRSTAARWLASARRELLETVRRQLRSQLGVTSAELESLAADIRSQIDVSLPGLLARSGGESLP
ncbi:MAG TPA: sigma-70 family RNA polymerase sigma factor [Polyangiaceae bacterium]|nr:sigma-70 family RNA polymerase sigma factor [Polyangiaceae bacterium]